MLVVKVVSPQGKQRERHKVRVVHLCLIVLQFGVYEMTHRCLTKKAEDYLDPPIPMQKAHAASRLTVACRRHATVWGGL